MWFIVFKKLKLMKVMQEEDDGTLLMLALFIHKRKNKATKDVFKSCEEGCIKISVERQFQRDEDLVFRQYCKLNCNQSVWC